MPLDATVSMLTDSDYASNVAFVAGGYVAGALAQNLIEGAAGMDLPNELYGIASIAASTYLSGSSMRYMAAGGGLYTADALAQRFGVKGTVTNLGA